MVRSGYRLNGHFAITYLDHHQALQTFKHLLPVNAPPWMTPKHVVNCIQNDAVQSHWHTTPVREGDWYFCRWEGIENILQVNASYWNDMDLKGEPETGCLGRPFIDEAAQKCRRASGCDFYIPDLEVYATLTKGPRSKLMNHLKHQVVKNKGT